MTDVTGSERGPDHRQRAGRSAWLSTDGTTRIGVETVEEALDLEGEKVAEEETGKAGACHRSACQLAGALPGSVAVVIFQDGGVRFVCQRDGRITYWEQE